MSSLIERRASLAGASFELTRPVFDLSSENPAILDVITQDNRQFLEAFELVKAKLPLPKTVGISMDGHFYRLPGHNRSFCYSLTDSKSFLKSAVFVFKGTEPLLPDFNTLLSWMSQAPLRRSGRVMTDHFPLAEGKIPGALSLKEAFREAEISLEIQKRHLRQYGELANIPTPLLIHSFSEQQKTDCAAHLHRLISVAAFERVEPLLQHGLAVYVYYYPVAPIRSNYWGGIVSPQVTQYIETNVRQEDAIQGWVRLIVRLIYLGFLPYSVQNEGLGACMDFGNATLEGGFCDPDSILPLESNFDDEFVREGLIQSLAILQSTVQLMLGLSEPHDLYPSINDFVCGQYLFNLLSAAVVSEARPELRLDERFAKLLFPKTLADVRTCTSRKNRIGSYAHFAKRLDGGRPN